MVYDTARGRPLVFGGSRDVATYLSSLALFDGTRWIDTPDAGAPPRGFAAMAFDSDRKRAVLFGGEGSEDAFSNETWEWDSATAKWILRTTDVSPPPLLSSSMAYDPLRKRAVLFGGWAPGFFVRGQTWEYRALGGTCETNDDCDGFACVDGACCVESECGACEACSTTTGQCEPLTEQTDPDSCSGDQICDAQGACKQGVSAACKSDAECANGTCADGVCCDRACEGACEACDVPGDVGTCIFVSGAARHGRCPSEPPCAGECDGESPACWVANSGVACGSSCDAAMFSTSRCDGEGFCVAGDRAECPNGFGCDDAGACLDACDDDDDCQAGLSCRDRACGEPERFCADRSTLHEPDGSERSCRPFACVSGECLESCQSAAQCAQGLVCDEAGDCLAPPSPSRDDVSGCGCRLAPGSERSASAPWLLLLLGFARRGRRAQKRARAPSRGKSAKNARAVSSSPRK
jgi:MYXO-CTERM domain-containing protein